MPKALCRCQVTPTLPLLGPWDLVVRAVTGVPVTGWGRPYRMHHWEPDGGTCAGLKDSVQWCAALRYLYVFFRASPQCADVYACGCGGTVHRTYLVNI